MGNQTIIVADDDPAYREMIQDLLAEEGYARVLCMHSDMAYEAIHREQPGLVLLDIHKAAPSEGWKLLVQLRQEPTTAAIPIVICTTAPRLFEALAAQLQSQDCEILEKPFQLEDLLLRVQWWIGPPRHESAATSTGG